MVGKTVKMAEKMEDNNSWNGMIFRHIEARKDWLLALIWRKRQEQEDDTAHKEVKSSDEKMDQTEDHPDFIKWCDERIENFNSTNSAAENEQAELNLKDFNSTNSAAENKKLN